MLGRLKAVAEGVCERGLILLLSGLGVAQGGELLLVRVELAGVVLHLLLLAADVVQALMFWRMRSSSVVRSRIWRWRPAGRGRSPRSGDFWSAMRCNWRRPASLSAAVAARRSESHRASGW